MPNLLNGIAFGAGFAIGFFVVELALQESWYRYSMWRLKRSRQETKLSNR